MTVAGFNITYSDGPKIIDIAELTNQTSDASRSLSISTHQLGDVIFAMIANRTTTAPALLSGYTNITTINNAGTNSRSVRLQFKIANNSTESISWTGAYGYMLAIRNASRILQSPVTNSNTAVSSVTIPDTTTLNQASKSLIVVGSYLTNLGTAVSSPYTLYSNTIGYLEKNSFTNSTSKTLTFSGSTTNVGYLVEII